MAQPHATAAAVSATISKIYVSYEVFQNICRQAGYKYFGLKGIIEPDDVMQTVALKGLEKGWLKAAKNGWILSIQIALSGNNPANLEKAASAFLWQTAKRTCIDLHRKQNGRAPRVTTKNARQKEQCDTQTPQQPCSIDSPIVLGDPKLIASSHAKGIEMSLDLARVSASFSNATRTLLVRTLRDETGQLNARDRKALSRARNTLRQTCIER